MSNWRCIDVEMPAGYAICHGVKTIYMIKADTTTCDWQLIIPEMKACIWFQKRKRDISEETIYIL